MPPPLGMSQDFGSPMSLPPCPRSLTAQLVVYNHEFFVSNFHDNVSLPHILNNEIGLDEHFMYYGAHFPKGVLLSFALWLFL